MWKNEYSWNPSSCICENSGYLKNLADNSVLRCNEIVSVTDSVSTNVTSTISINVTSTVLINFDDKKVWFKMDYHILHMFFIRDYITIYDSYYLLSLWETWSKQKNSGTLTM